MLRDGSEPAAVNEVSCNDWREIDRTLQGLAKQRAALDAEEARWLRADVTNPAHT